MNTLYVLYDDGMLVLKARNNEPILFFANDNTALKIAYNLYMPGFKGHNIPVKANRFRNRAAAINYKGET